MIDETTNICNKKILTINSKYFYKGEKKFKILGVVELENGEASTVYQMLKKLLILMEFQRKL